MQAKKMSIKLEEKGKEEERERVIEKDRDI